MKKIMAVRAAVSLILTLVLVLSGIPVSAENTDTGCCGPFLYWSYDSNTAQLTISGEGPMYNYSNFSDTSDCAPFSQYRGEIKKIVIEEGCTYIGSYAFSGMIHITEVSFPESSLKEIGAYAFNYCIEITRFVIPDSVLIIGEYAFTACQELRVIKFPNGITSLPNGVCSRNGELLAAFIPKSCTSVGNSAFYECKKLTDIDISGVEYISANSFNSCSSLKKVTFGEGIKNIGENSYYACSGISEFEFLGTPDFISSGFAYGTAWYKAKDDGIYIICGEILLCKGTYSEASLVVPDGVKTIGESVFANCSNITSVTLPEGLERIGDFAFFKLSSLKSMEIPESVSFIGQRAVGYKASGSSQSTLDPSFTVYGKGGAAWEYSASQGLNYVCLHEYEEKTDVEDCTEGGTAFEECIFCGDRINETEVRPYSNHSIIETEFEVTCEKNGEIRLECKRCSFSFNEITEKATGHTAGVWQVVKEPTCEEYGIIGRLCVKCGVLTEEKKEIEKKEHELSDSERVIQPLGCTVDGIYEKYCKNCDGAVEIRVEKARGHVSQEFFTVVKESVDGVPGYEVKYCTGCGTVTEGRWFTVFGEEVSPVEYREAVAVCKLFIRDVIIGNAPDISEEALDFNRDGRFDAKDCLELKKLSA